MFTTLTRVHVMDCCKRMMGVTVHLFKEEDSENAHAIPQVLLRYNSIRYLYRAFRITKCDMACHSTMHCPFQSSEQPCSCTLKS